MRFAFAKQATIRDGRRENHRASLPNVAHNKSRRLQRRAGKSPNENHRQLFTQAFGLADQFFLVRCATTFGANVRRVADKLLVCLEVRLQQLLEFTERSGHWTTHPKYGQNHAERDFRAPPCSEYLSFEKHHSRQNRQQAIETQSQQITRINGNVNFDDQNARHIPRNRVCLPAHSGQSWFVPAGRVTGRQFACIETLADANSDATRRTTRCQQRQRDDRQLGNPSSRD